MNKATFNILATLLFVTQTAWAQCHPQNVEALYEAVRTNQTVILDNEFTLDNGRLDIDGTIVTLDLNGHTLTRPMAAADAGGQVIFVKNNGKLTITDSSTGGTITGGWSYQGGGIYVSTGCELTITGGTITGNRADQIGGGGYGYGGAIENHGTLSITGGVITGNTAGQFGGGIHNEGMLTLDGVTIQGNSAQYGGGIYMFKSAETSPGTVQLQGACTITDNTASSYGKDVYQNQGTTFNIQGRPVVDDVYLTYQQW